MLIGDEEIKNTVIRDFFRQRRIARHVMKNGWQFDFHGVQVSLPENIDLAIHNALIQGKYEVEEAELISRYLPKNKPVLELGGSLGVVSSLIGSLLEETVLHVIVEANPALIEVCSKNVARSSSQVFCKAVSYNGATALFDVKSNPHASMLSGATSENSNTIEVEATTLSALWHGMGAPEGYTLISDIEGAEVEMVVHDAETLSHAGLIIIELHPHLHTDGLKVIDRINNTLVQAGFFLSEKTAEVYVWIKRDV